MLSIAEHSLAVCMLETSDVNTKVNVCLKWKVYVTECVNILLHDEYLIIQSRREPQVQSLVVKKFVMCSIYFSSN